MLIAGVDEVGRGPLAGPVVAAAVILNNDAPISGLDDSKKLTEKRRISLDAQIRQHAHCYAIGYADVGEIDQLNILHATMLAMQRAVAGLDVTPDMVYVDGNRVPELPCEAEAIVGGDGKVAEISAASIIAKVYRDSLMKDLHEQYPHYGFASNKGYPSKQHRDALLVHGVTPLHRRSFAPVRAALER
jgi:ribonuclease HII